MGMVVDKSGSIVVDTTPPNKYENWLDVRRFLRQMCEGIPLASESEGLGAYIGIVTFGTK